MMRVIGKCILKYKKVDSYVPATTVVTETNGTTWNNTFKKVFFIYTRKRKRYNE